MSFNEKQYQKNMYLKIKDLYVNKKYKSLLKETTIYLNIFPNDMNVRFMRAKAYRYLNMFNEAISDLEYNNKLKYDHHTVVELFYIYYYLYRYEEALNLLPTLYNNKDIKPHSLLIAETIMKKELNIPIRNNDNCRWDYIKFQILNYDKEKAINHIKKHLNKAEDNYQKTMSHFKENLNLNYLYDLITNNLKNSNKTNNEEILEIYYFAISNIGVNSDDTYCNFIKVVVVPKTNNIISIYPTIYVDDDYINIIDIDYDKLFNRDNNVKQKSMIDKFNNRYNRK